MFDKTTQPPQDMRTAAIALHELMTSYVDAGFSRAEAIELVKSHVNASIADNENG